MKVVSLQTLKLMEEVIETILEAIEKAGYKHGDEISLALDVAASEMYSKEKGKYLFFKSSGEEKSGEEMIKIYETLLSKYPNCIIGKMGLDENDWERVGNLIGLIA